MIYNNDNIIIIGVLGRVSISGYFPPMFQLLLTRARVAVSATFAMVGGGGKMTPPNSKTRKARRPGDTAIDSS